MNTTKKGKLSDKLRIHHTASANNGFKKLAVLWLTEHLYFVLSVVLADSFVLRNRQLLKPAKRYLQPFLSSVS
jgi:hypothetical protein